MQVTRERKQTITVEFGLAEAREVVWQLRAAARPGDILDRLQERLAYHVEQATGSKP